LRRETALTEYCFGRGIICHVFCSTCGIKPFGRVSDEQGGESIAINVVCLDNASDEELANAPVKFENGRADDYEHPPAVTEYL
jgi:hypothetical protein